MISNLSNLKKNKKIKNLNEVFPLDAPKIN